MNWPGEYAGKVKIGKVNIDDQQALAAEYGVSAIPDHAPLQARPGHGTDGRPQEQARA